MHVVSIVSVGGPMRAQLWIATVLLQGSGNLSKYMAISSVWQLQVKTIGLPGFLGLWIFGRI